MTRPIAAALIIRLAFRSKWHWRHTEVTVTSYSEAGHYLLETYVISDVVAHSGVYIMRFTPPSNNFLMKYAEALWNKGL